MLSVTDGDTIRVELGGRTVTVRYIGVDTPETVDPGRPVEPFGREASEANRRLVEGRTVLLEKDVSETDRFGRLLRYVYVEQFTGLVMVNAELVRLGYARIATFPPDVRYASLFLDLEREARAASRGLWAASAPTSTPTRTASPAPTFAFVPAAVSPSPTTTGPATTIPPPAVTPPPTSAATTAPPSPVPTSVPTPVPTAPPTAPAATFDPSRYIGQGDAYNCADFASQAQAQAVLRADPRDPNRLDADRDGIACENNRAPRDLVPVAR